MPFPHPSSNFYLEAGLSKGLTAVWWVPLGWCVTSDICPNWLPPALGFAFCIVSEPYPEHTLFIKFMADFIIRKVGVDWPLSIDKILPFSPDQRQQISSSFERLQFGIMLRTLQCSWKSAYTVAAHASKSQSLQKDGLPEVPRLG